MGKYYKLDSYHDMSDFISFGETLSEIRLACQMTEWQHISTEAVELKIAEDSGTKCPDFIFDYGIPIVSYRFKEFLEQNKVGDVLYKKFIVTQEKSGLREDYYLALPKAINCLNRDKSVINEWDELEKLVISDSAVGRYKYFKIADVSTFDIYITEELYEEIKKQSFIGIYMEPIKEA